MKTRLTVSILAAAAAILLLSVGQTQATTSLFTTQDDFSGWSGGAQYTLLPIATPDEDGSNVNGLGNTTGSSLGAGSLLGAWNSGSFDYLFSQGEQSNVSFLTALGTGGNIIFDYQQPPAGSGNYFQLGVVLNYPGHFDQTFGPTGPVDLGNGWLEQTVPYTYTGDLAPSYFQIGLIVNSNFTGAPLYVDNIRTDAVPVPEPASIVLTVVGGLGLCLAGVRHRRNLNS